LGSQRIAAEVIVAPLIVECVQIDIDKVVQVDIVPLGVSGTNGGRIWVVTGQAKIDIILIMENQNLCSNWRCNILSRVGFVCEFEHQTLVPYGLVQSAVDRDWKIYPGNREQVLAFLAMGMSWQIPDQN